MEHKYLPYYNITGVTQQYKTHAHGHGIELLNSENVYVTNMKVYNVIGDALYIGGQSNTINPKTTITDCEFHHSRRQGITIGESDATYIKNTTIHHIGTFDGISRNNANDRNRYRTR